MFVPTEEQPLSVSACVQALNELLKPIPLWVEGEITALSESRGFLFFSLKEVGSDATLPCFAVVQALGVPLEDGMVVRLYGTPGIHQKSGRFSVTVRRVVPQGQGTINRAFQLLEAKLTKDGIIDPARKRPLPHLPQRIGVVSSRDAAGYGDFLRILENRIGLKVVLVHVAVQGKDAEREIVRALDLLNEQAGIELIAVLRGGGSQDDLHAFNSELVARAIARSKAPVLVGVGHEKDVTIADLVADVRAATPSNAAQLVMPLGSEITQEVVQRLKTVEQRLLRELSGTRERVQYRVERLERAVQDRLVRVRQEVLHRLQTLEAIQPEHTLRRGYAIVRQSGVVLRSTSQATSEQIQITLADGVLNATPSD